MFETVRMPVTVLLVVGDRVEFTTPDRDHRDPMAEPLAKVLPLVEHLGLNARTLPGVRLVASIDRQGDLVGLDRP
ncbi:hypothetical protein [Embleya sp. NPDC059237]|uniref:hypothetical protein n=1 Tax=Embleya sp. NPDC059237 TaxID=3346784 RepID=UPI003688BE44